MCKPQGPSPFVQINENAFGEDPWQDVARLALARKETSV